MIGQIIYDSGGLGANRNVSGKLGMKLAGYSYLDTAAVCWDILVPWGWGNSCMGYGGCRLQTALAASS